MRQIKEGEPGLLSVNEAKNKTSKRPGLQGLRPPPLKIAKVGMERKPAIIYVRSPRLIHTQPQNFKPLVQGLTGNRKKKKKCREKAHPQVMPEAQLTTIKSPSEFKTPAEFTPLPPSSTPSQLYAGMLPPFSLSPFLPFSPNLFSISPP
ncbi:hypothetical protein SUGI_0435060 [Cryptomeria japonica]|nr:hypothetical protein SUGI_0435060 [Cryptomeria japonica]